MVARDILNRVLPSAARPACTPIAILLGMSAVAATARGGKAPQASAGPATSTIGRTWAIAEPDALSEIEAKVASLPKDMRKRFGPRSNWSALKAASLAPAPADRVRAVVPFYTLDFDIKLPDGRTLYPKGYSFNPLSYVRMRQRLVIVAPRDLWWALRTAKSADFILVTAGDAVALSEKTGRPIYILEERVKQRLGLTVAPVIVAQQGPRLVLAEFGPKSRTATPSGSAKGGRR